MGLRNCEELDVSSNSIVELPDDIDHMKSLVVFDVSHNKLKYLPEAVGE